MNIPKRVITVCAVGGLMVVGSCGALAYVASEHPGYLPVAVEETLVMARIRLSGWVRQVTPSIPTLPPFTKSPEQDAESSLEDSVSHVTLYLKNGGIVMGEMVKRTKDAVTLRFDYGEAVFSRREVRRLVTGRELIGEGDIVLPKRDVPDTWTWSREVVFRLLNGAVLDAELVVLDGETLQLVKPIDGGGSVELSIPMAKLDQVMFRPVENARSQEIRETLETTFPDMHWHTEGVFTIVTDSPSPTVKGYWRIIRELTTDFYLSFYPILKGRSTQTQQYIVIFDDWGDFMEYAIADGVPGWAVLGYFMPDDEILYMYNVLGDGFSELLYEAFLGRARHIVDGAVDSIKGQLDSRRHIFLEGMATELKSKFERAHSIIRSGYREMTEMVLRHELTHGLFHNWGLQTIILSKLPGDQREEAQKKRKYLESEDPEEKRRILLELVNPDARAPIEIQAANSWVSEGLAAYMERPRGSTNTLRLYLLQEALRDRQLLPLEFLNVFKLGSFPGITHKGQIYAYSQSWALVKFFMERYPEGFLQFLSGLATETAADDEELEWLLEAVGKDLRPLDQEFHEYVTQFPELDPPWLVTYETFLEIFRTY